MLLTPEEIKGQLRLDADFTDEDALLDLLARAVQTRTETFLNRKLYAPDAGIPDTDPDGLNLPDDIRLGMMLLVTHFYENRSTSSEVEMAELPMSFNWLVGPYRYIPL
ncbi:head-tail connector protein [Cedecea sp.]|uniref:head-tail connector protein n=1 Tax=Cedecea sp. TaxID=1970739 RepID=UPI002F3EA66C